METFVIYKLGFNQNYYTFALILLTKIVLCSKFHWTKFIDYECFHMTLHVTVLDFRTQMLLSRAFDVAPSHSTIVAGTNTLRVQRFLTYKKTQPPRTLP